MGISVGKKKQVPVFSDPHYPSSYYGEFWHQKAMEIYGCPEVSQG